MTTSFRPNNDKRKGHTDIMPACPRWPSVEELFIIISILFDLNCGYYKPKINFFKRFFEIFHKKAFR